MISRCFFRTGLGVASLFAFALSLHSQPVSLVGQLNQPRGGPGPNYGFYYASCWGYVAPDGHEYALLGTYSGTQIIDLDAVPIAEVAYIPGANSEWKELKTWGHYAYAVSEGSQGIQIINLSQLPDTAWLVGSVTSVGGKNVNRNHSITVADGYLYLNGSTGSGQTGGVIILSLANPENPTYAGEYQPAYIHDSYVRNDTIYAAAIYGQGVYIANISNKSSPQLMGNLTYPNAGTHNTWASVNGRYVFTTDEIGTTQKNMKVFDIQNLPSFTQQTPYTANPAAVIHNIHGRGNHVYIAHYAAGVYVSDVHNPLAITTAGSYDTYTGPSTGYIGAWGVYPYFPSGRWIASDTQTGLYVFTFSGLQPRIRSPLLLPADEGVTVHGSPMTFRWRQAASQVEDPHYYQLHLWGQGIDTLVKTRDTSLTLSSLPSLEVGENYSWHVWIKDEFTSVSSQDTFSFVPLTLPSVPVQTSPSDQASDQPLIVMFQWQSTPFASSYSLQVAEDSLFQDVAYFDSTLVDTYSVVGPLVGSTQYFWRVQAKNALGYGTWSNHRVLVTTNDVSVQHGVIEGWNLVSVPLLVNDLQTASVFPSAVSPAYAFVSGGYVQQDTLQRKTGYWVKFPASGNISIVGDPVENDTIDVFEGWNLIGSISDSIPTTEIAQIPSGIIDSGFYTFLPTGYGVSSVLSPGGGYWVKVNQNGKLVLMTTSPRR
ncbi:MAG: LVIVD repeat-containing protein [Bacteroidota bacterium]